jgi:RHS repeat-associated protein
MVFSLSSQNVYFAGNLVSAEGSAVAVDPLGSVRWRVTASHTYYPYGVEYSATANDTEKYATYTRDSLTGLDYAVNRYYSSIWGRFLSPDPYQVSNGGPGDVVDPGSWNRYVYVLDDPVNRMDSSGQYSVLVCTGSQDDLTCNYVNVGSQEGGSGGGASSNDPGGLSASKDRRLNGIRSNNWDVTKHYWEAIHCNLTAQQVESTVEKNFSNFANFVDTLKGSIDTVTFSPPGPLTAGMVIPISVNVMVPNPFTKTFSDAYSLDTSVRVIASTPNLIAFSTVPGHLLFPAQIAFSASDIGNGTIGFSIDLQGKFPGLTNGLLFRLGGSQLEDDQWNNFLAKVKELCNK